MAKPRSVFNLMMGRAWPWNVGRGHLRNPAIYSGHNKIIKYCSYPIPSPKD